MYCEQVVAVKAPGFGERKTSYLEDIAILTGATVIRDETGLSLDKVWREPPRCEAEAGRITTAQSGCWSGRIFLECDRVSAVRAVSGRLERPRPGG